MKTLFALLTTAALCLSLCACMASGSSSAPASGSGTTSTAAPTTEPSSSMASGGSASSQPASSLPDSTLPSAVIETLNASVAYGSDTAGGSLKTAQVSAALVQVLAENGVPANLTEGANSWKATLTAEQLSLLSLNWESISQVSRDIAADPASQKDYLESAGVETDFTALDLTGISAAMDSLDAALKG